MSFDHPTTRAEHFERARYLLDGAERTGDGYSYTNSDVQAAANRSRAANDIAIAHVHALLATAPVDVAGESEGAGREE